MHSNNFLIFGWWLWVVFYCKTYLIWFRQFEQIKTVCIPLVDDIPKSFSFEGSSVGRTPVHSTFSETKNTYKYNVITVTNKASYVFITPATRTVTRIPNIPLGCRISQAAYRNCTCSRTP